MKRILHAAGIAALLFLIWLLAVWPPPIWYRTHWPAQTAFMWMRRAGGRAGRRAVTATQKAGSRPPATARESFRAIPPSRLYDPVPADSISPFVAEAVQIGEDNAFPTHSGIDWRSLRRAIGYRRDAFSWTDARDREELWQALPAAWSHREALRGASTITQQLAKNLYLSPSRNPLRKVKEAVTAYRLEAALGKDRILELYLNVAELGDGIWGVEAASQYYFHRSAAQLSAEQAAALAGSLPFPLRSNPGYRPGRMRWRQNLILRRLEGEPVEVPPEVAEDIPAPEEGIVAPLDSVQGDSTQAAADSAAAPLDSTAPKPDSLAQDRPDTLTPPAPPDSAR
jgi:monofunctional biosynthetic peptidoglycan transglycosylase